MNDVLVVAGHALRESLRRRVFAVVVCLTLAFGALYAWGTDELFQDINEFGPNQFGLDPRVLAGATILGLAMFGTLFLGVVLAVFLTLGAVRGDAERGLLQPLIVRPLGRRQYLAGRFLAAGSVAAAYVLVVYTGAVVVTGTLGAVRGDAERGLLQPLIVRPLGRRQYLAGRFVAAATVAAFYVVVVYAGAVVVTGTIGDWWPENPVGAGLRLAAAVVVVAAIALLGSIFLSANANGIAVLMVFGAGLLGGLLGSIGDALESHTLQAIANTASWVLPFEALYRDALRVLVAEVPGVTGAIVQLGPLGGSHDAGPLLWPYLVAYLAAVAVTAAVAFGRSDL